MCRRVALLLAISTLFDAAVGAPAAGLSEPEAAAPSATAVTSDAATWVATLSSRYWISAGLTYLTVDGQSSQLDVFVSRQASDAAPAPVVVYVHGGGWTGGSRIVGTLHLLPYLEQGFSVVNVDYRLGPAPAAVEDCRCALAWVVANAAKYRLDPGRLVVTGDSAGSHLALLAGMLPAGSELDRRCSASPVPPVAAVVNWFGATDVAELIDGPRQQPFALRWLGDRADRLELARRLSPLTYVRSGLPPILSIHGDADALVPHEQALRLHRALDRVGVANQLKTVAGGGHGGFAPAALVDAFATVRAFLARHLLPPAAASTGPR